MLRDLSEKVSYLQGLSEGLNITEGNPQGKIISGILGVLNEMSEEISQLQEDMDEIREYLENIDDDLLDLEETIFEDNEFMEISCRNCGEKLFIESDIFADVEDSIEVICPCCNEVVFVNDNCFDCGHESPELNADTSRGYL
ncbi:Uncharacterized [Syntrophomonas zehnderi OL-4]|uniref:Uncharacterized n=1 Tax=Syntrophomonas zehnderi OL-4 TaxID=690567 RepID=A0A0E3W346_9FIRM|nr:CD1247 N-terminal domain-containing protein [Syntrophomonas zehnderi]CFX49027.1 Uncharacterized [Syntrophomonas zehnderi OL-4]